MRMIWVLLLAGCAGNPCKQGTIFLSLTFDSGAEAADQLVISIGVDGGAAVQRTVGRTSGKSSDQVEVDFSGSYPAGKTLTISVMALAGGTAVGAASGQFTSAPGCTAYSLRLSGGAADLGADLARDRSADGGVDLGADLGPDLAAPGPCKLDVDTLDDGCLFAP
jgi:hypothetical protein